MDDEEYGKEEPIEGSGDNEFQLERVIQAWNNSDTEQWDIVTSNDKNAPMKLHKIGNEPSTDPSSNDEIKE